MPAHDSKRPPWSFPSRMPSNGLTACRSPWQRCQLPSRCRTQRPWCCTSASVRDQQEKIELGEGKQWYVAAVVEAGIICNYITISIIYPWFQRKVNIFEVADLSRKTFSETIRHRWFNIGDLNIIVSPGFGGLISCDAIGGSPQGCRRLLLNVWDREYRLHGTLTPPKKIKITLFVWCSYAYVQ